MKKFMFALLAKEALAFIITSSYSVAPVFSSAIILIVPLLPGALSVLSKFFSRQAFLAVTISWISNSSLPTKS